MRSTQCQVSGTRMTRQPASNGFLLGKANSRAAKCCVFCLFVKLRLSPGHIGGPGIKISRVIVVRTKSV